MRLMASASAGVVGQKTEVQHNLEAVSVQRNAEVFFPLEISIIRLKDGIILPVRFELDG